MSKLKPAIICGGAVGVVLVITGLIVGLTKVGALGCCNCLWPIAGGLLATMMYIKGSQTPASAGDGAVVGLLAGLVGALIHIVVALPLQYFLFAEALEIQMAQLRDRVPNFPFTSIVPFLIISAILGFIVSIVLSIIGGLIAVPIFEKRKGSMPPPPPQGFGGGQAA